MELSEEQKQRIIEEEKLRLAEEQYREQVRKDLLKPTATSGDVPPPIDATLQSKSKTNLKILAYVCGMVALCGLLFLVVPRHSLPSSETGATTATPLAVQKKVSLVPVKLTTAQIAEKATQSVVVVENISDNGEKVGQGSGYVYSDNGTMITNYHVIRGAGTLNVRLHSGASFRVDSIVGYDIAHDVAILQATGASVSALPTEEVELAKVGDKVVAIGAPFGLESTVSEGIVSALREMNGTHILQTTTSISPGSSGGPLLNEFGKVIGLTTAQMRDGQNLNFVISAVHITELLERKNPITLAEMLTETQTTTSIASNTFMVPARNGWKVNLNVPMQQGAVLEGSYEIRGGGGNDVDVMLTTSDNRVVLNSGRVSGMGQIKVQLPRGNYLLYFNNQFSTFTSKSVSPDLKLTYYR